LLGKSTEEKSCSTLYSHGLSVLDMPGTLKILQVPRRRRKSDTSQKNRVSSASGFL